MVSTNDNKNLGAVKGQGYSGSWELNLKKKKPRKWKYGMGTRYTQWKPMTLSILCEHTKTSKDKPS
jgi:hypothetical protein